MSAYVIQYDSHSRVAHGDGPMVEVGRVYAHKCDWGEHVWSQQPDAAKATRFPTRDAAEKALARYRWRGAEILEVPA